MLNFIDDFIKANELSGSVGWIPEGRTPQMFQFPRRPFTNNRLFNFYSNWLSSMTGNTAGSSTGSTAVDLRQTSLATSTQTLTDYVVVSSLATIVKEQATIN